MPTTSKRQREATAFKDAVTSLPRRISAKELPRSVLVLKPRLPRESYPVSSALYNFQVTNAARKRAASFNGALLNVNGPEVREMIYLGGIGSSLAAGKKVMHLEPRTVVSKPTTTEADTAFAHVVLLHRRGKPVVFVSCFQKNMGHSRSTKGRYVDYHVGTQGSDRHFLPLALAQYVVEEMKRRGVNAELHVPAAHHLHFRKGTPAETKERAQKPFRVLAQHFETGELKLLGIPFTSINLSKPLRKG